MIVGIITAVAMTVAISTGETMTVEAMIVVTAGMVRGTTKIVTSHAKRTLME